jgi:hypothetical protein
MVERPVDFRRLQHRTAPKRKQRPTARLALIGVAGFVTLNLLISLVYFHRALPRTHLGTLDVSGRSASSLRDIASSQIVPPKLTLTHDTTSATYHTQGLGITLDKAASIEQIGTGWHWLPLISLLTNHYSPVIVHTDQAVFTAANNTAAQQFQRDARGKHVGLSENTFAILPASKGYELRKDALLATILHAIRDGKNRVAVPTTITTAPVSDENKLASELSKLQKQLSTQVSFKYKGQTIVVPTTDRSKWFTASGISMTASAEMVKPYMTQLAHRLGITIANPDDLATAAAYALDQADTRTFAVVPTGSSTIVRTYCTATRNVSDSVLAALENNLAITYNDVRGWNDSGRVAFKHVSSGCQYTVWMSAAADVTTFGTICDNYYNCQVGPNVIMNYDRWTSATPPWNKAGGTMSDYHALMINHETGHRLGFADNPVCLGAGEPALVMMQQSIDLKGCVFNVWPRPPEFNQLDQILGLN